MTVAGEIGHQRRRWISAEVSKRDEPPSSEEVAGHWRDRIRWCIDRFGPQRCTFESNFPVDRATLPYAVLWNSFQIIAADYDEADRHEQDLSRVVVVGTFCEQPPLGLLLTLERAGCWIVDDDLLLGLRWLTRDVTEDGDPLERLALAYLEASSQTASVYQPEGRRGGWLVDSVKRYAAEGVIFAAPSFCDPALLDRPMLVRALNEANIPNISFKYAENSGQMQPIREQAGTFADSIKLWSEA